MGWTVSRQPSENCEHIANLVAVARYCETISAIPPIARYGVFGVSAWAIGCDTPSPFSERGGAIPPPPPKGVSQRYLRDTMKTRQNVCDTSLCDTISKGYCAIWGVSRIGPLRLGPWLFRCEIDNDQHTKTIVWGTIGLHPVLIPVVSVISIVFMISANPALNPLVYSCLK